MKCLLCRVMCVVFLLNCLTPATGWGQTSRRTNMSSLERQVNAQIQKAQADNSPAALYERADTLARQAHQQHFARADRVARQQRMDELQKNVNQLPDGVAVASSTQVVKPMIALPVFSSVKDFLRKVQDNEILFEDLIEYADPMDPAIGKNNLEVIAYASEIIGNTTGQLTQLDPSQYDAEEIQKTLAQTEARLAYRLALLGDKVPSFAANSNREPASAARTSLQQVYGGPSTQRTMAVGTLRMTLLKIHQFYQAQHLPDPAEEYQKQKLAERMKKQQPQPPQRAVGEHKPVAVSGGLPAAAIEERAAQGVNQYGNLAKFQQQFIDELKQAVAQKPKEGTEAYQNLQLLAEYATAYALEYKPEAVKEIVKIFDDGVKHDIKGKVKAGNFHHTYSPILNAIFTTVFENTRYNSLTEAQTKKVLNLLMEFSAPERYSLPTRVFSLEAASLLYRPLHHETLSFNKKPVPAYLQGVSQEWLIENNYALPSPKTWDEYKSQRDVYGKAVKGGMREVFANRVANIYCPLTQANYDDYGLSSQEMQALADKLAYIYDGFYDISREVVAASGSEAAHHNPASCKMVMKNEPNRMKKDAEMQGAIFRFTGEVLFWVYGGELFSFIGTAYRLTRGAVASMPKAYKAFKSAGTLNAAKAGRFSQAAQRGRTGLKLAGQEIKDGAKFSNFIGKNINQQGYFVELVPAAESKAPLATTTQVGPVKRVSSIRDLPGTPITSVSQLQGKYSRWNPKRWFGMNPQHTYVGMRVTRMEPGFKTTVAEAVFDHPVDGLHSLQDIYNAWDRLYIVGDASQKMVYETKPYWQAILDLRQAQWEQWMLGGLKKSLRNQVDLWIPMGEAAQTGAKVTQNTKWWNVGQWGRPEQLQQIVASNMPLFIAPKTSMNLARNMTGKVMSSEGIADIASILPGFYTTGADLVSGNVQRQMFNAFFKPLNWKNGVAKTFLPDYMPTATFWESVQKNPILGVQLMPQLLWRNRFAATTTFFGLWMGADYGLYPFYKGWMEKEATQEMKQEIAKYGDTFSEQRAKMDELLYQELGVDLSDKRAMTTYQDVLAAQPEQPDGTLIVAPIVVARHALNNTPLGNTMGLPFVNEGLKTEYAIQAHQGNLNHATLVKTYNQVKANEQTTQQWQQEQRSAIEEDERAVLAAYAQGFAQAPQLKKQLHEIYQTYEKEFFAAVTKTQQEVEQVQQRFVQRRDAILDQAAQWQQIFELADEVIKGVKTDYNELVTPAVEARYRQIFRTYAREWSAATSVEMQSQAYRKAQQAIQALEEELKDQQEQLFNQKYGVDFNPNAGEALTPVPVGR